MSPMASHITAFPVFVQRVFEVEIKTIKAPRHWPLWGESTGDHDIGPVTRKMFPFDDLIM